MKKKFLCLVLFSSVIMYMSAQWVGHEVKFYSSNGEKFTLFVNNHKINSEPASEIEMQKIYMNSLNVKVIFDEAPQDTICQENLMITSASRDDMLCPYKTVYKIQKTKKKKQLSLGKYEFIVEKMDCMYEKPKRYHAK